MSEITTKDIIEFFAKVPLFTQLKPKHIKTLAERARIRDYETGDAIVEQGTEGVGLYIMAQGSASVKRIHPNGTSLEIDTLQRFDFFGELSLLDDAPRSASVIADTPVKAVLLTKLDFFEELEDDPHMAIAMLKILAHRFRRIVTHL
jgi:CRP/FNR family transcriptional regulator, cyclic AMP receptor protein